MKRTLSLLLALVLVLGSFSTVFAAMPETDVEKAELLKELGILLGNNSGDLMLDDDLLRRDAVVLLSRLMKAEETARNFPTDDMPFDDNYDPLYDGYIAWAHANGYAVGISATKFDPKGDLTAQQFATFLLRALGYEIDAEAYETAFETAEELGIFADLNVEKETVLKRKDMAVMTFNALYVPMKDSEVTLGEYLELELPEEEPAKLEVVAIKAKSARSFEVTFNKAVTDEDILTFEVTRSSSKVSVTPAFSEDKLSVVLNSSSAFAVGNYTVKVLANGEEIAKQEISIEAQKLAKIEITSSVLSVGQDGNGFATYAAYDQYGEDVTTSYLAQSIQFMTGVGTVTKKDGLLTVVPNSGVNLIALPTVTISAYDTNSAVTTTANLTPALAIGTLKSFDLLPEGTVTLIAGDTTTVVYIPFKAVDMSGNETKNYEIIKQGLILDTANNDALTVSNNWVTANLVQDPANPNNAAIKVVATVSTPGNFNVELPFTITAMTKNGYVSTISAVLKPAPAVDSITLFTPTQVVAVGERAVIPFEAYDSEGNKLTKTSQINPDQNLSLNGLSYGTKVDGTMYLYTTDMFTTEGPKMFSASVTRTGKFSNITVVAQKAAKADSMTLNLSTRAQEVGRLVRVGFGYNGLYTGISVKDQYGRSMDMVRGGYDYKVVVTKEAGNETLEIRKMGTTTEGAISVEIGSGKEGIEIIAKEKGAETLKFELKDSLGNTIATRAHTFTVVNTSDIVSYTVAPLYGELYAGPTGHNTTIFVVRGKTASGTLVDLASSSVSAKPVNVEDFDSTGNGIRAKASTAGYTAKASETVVNITVMHGANIQMLTTNVKSSLVKPYAVDIGFSISDDEALDGARSLSSDILTIDATDFASINEVADLSEEGFWIEDNYGRYLLSPVNYYITSKAIASGDITVDANGEFDKTGTLAAGDSFLLTAVTENGLVKTIKVVLE